MSTNCNVRLLCQHQTISSLTSALPIPDDSYDEETLMAINDIQEDENETDFALAGQRSLNPIRTGGRFMGTTPPTSVPSHLLSRNATLIGLPTPQTVASRKSQQHVSQRTYYGQVNRPTGYPVRNLRTVLFSAENAPMLTHPRLLQADRFQPFFSFTHFNAMQTACIDTV
jgi:hypothetical protein